MSKILKDESPNHLVFLVKTLKLQRAALDATQNNKGEQYIMACRVVVGEYCVGQQDALTPSVRDAKSQSLYDSTVGLLHYDTMANPSIYVTYHDAQAYPDVSFVLYFVQYIQGLLLTLEFPPTVFDQVQSYLGVGSTFSAILQYAALAFAPRRLAGLLGLKWLFGAGTVLMFCPIFAKLARLQLAASSVLFGPYFYNESKTRISNRITIVYE